MSLHDPSTAPHVLPRLFEAAQTIGFEIVDLSGFLDLIEQQASGQKNSVTDVRNHAATVTNASDKVLELSAELGQMTDHSLQEASETVGRIRTANESSQGIASWVSDLHNRTDSVSATLGDVSKNNAQIVSIARQVNTLAINAKIEAARAGDAGRGFSVVADAINELSRQTGATAVQISSNLESLTSWILAVADEAKEVSTTALEILKHAQENDESLSGMEAALRKCNSEVAHIVGEAKRMRDAASSFAPSLQGIDAAVATTSDQISQANQRIHRLIDTSETVVQAAAALGNAGPDAKYVTHVQSAAAEASRIFDAAIKSGRMTVNKFFDSNYMPISGTDPVQLMTSFTEFTDDVMPALQEPALDLDPKVVFCAAVDQNGYLPTHNLKFSQPQGSDPVWNMANCRNRRLFDDRVGLKAGRNTDPFLMQIYRRDMGGGEFAMMKDISAPIFVEGRHWGGLRLAVKF